MNPTRGTPAYPSTPIFDFDARLLTSFIPVRWRAAVLVLGTVTLFPLVITVMMFDAVTHDMPGLRAPLKRVFGVVSSWFRVSRVGQASETMAFSGLADAPSSFRGSVA